MSYLKSLYQDRNIIMQLAKSDFKVKYLGSYLGVFWAFMNPIIMILIYWFVFQIGFRSMPIGDVPFVLWLTAGIIPWFFISEAISVGTYSIIDKSYLVKKVLFRISILPIIKIVSTLFIHVIFIVIMFVLFIIYGFKLDVYHIQVLYYLIASVVLVYGISLITSSLVIFSKDVGQIIGIIMQFGFWLTPIFWSFTIVPEKLQLIFKLNPFYYIVEGYRDAFIHKVWFWENPLLTAYFWIVTFIIVFIGYVLFKKLKPHFSDVL